MKVVIDADYLLYRATEGKAQKGIAAERGEALGGDYKPKLKPYKIRFSNEIAGLLETMYVNDGMADKITKVKLLFSDPDGNFRYKLYPKYKGDRTSTKSPEFYRLREWALKKYGYVKNIEADDRCYDYVKKGWVCVSMDKDVRRGLPGRFFNPHHTKNCFEETSAIEAQHFVLYQTLMGDSVDKIPGIPGVGDKTAVKLLNELGWDWQGVRAAFGQYGFDEEYAITMRRLVDMRQYSKKKGLKLWIP